MAAPNDSTSENPRQNHSGSETSAAAGAGSVDLEKHDGGNGADDSVAGRQIKGVKVSPMSMLGWNGF